MDRSTPSFRTVTRSVGMLCLMLALWLAQWAMQRHALEHLRAQVIEAAHSPGHSPQGEPCERCVLSAALAHTAPASSETPQRLLSLTLSVPPVRQSVRPDVAAPSYFQSRAPPRPAA